MGTDLKRRQWQLLGLALLLGALIRCVIAGLSIGSNDAEIWRWFAFHIQEHGVVATYRDWPLFNHPPVMGWISWLTLELAQLLHRRFIYVFKVVTLLSEVACAWFIWLSWRKEGQRKAAQMVALFSLNGVSILLSSYHGNTDCLFAMLCLASAYAFSCEKWLWAGLALGAAINVKVVPLMLIPIFVAMLPSFRALQLFGGGLVLCALPFLPVIWQAREEFFRNVFGYNSIPFQWGIPLLIESTEKTLPRVATWLSTFYVPNARFVILGFMLLIAWLQRRRRQLSIFEAGALALSTFLVLVPGFGVQYLVWPLPLLFASQPRVAVKYSLYGGVFAFLVYYLFWNGKVPAFSGFATGFPPPSPFVGVLAWVTLIGFCVTGFRKLLGSYAADSPAESGVREHDPAAGAAVSSQPEPAPVPLVVAESR